MGLNQPHNCESETYTKDTRQKLATLSTSILPSLVIHILAWDQSLFKISILTVVVGITDLDWGSHCDIWFQWISSVGWKVWRQNGSLMQAILPCACSLLKHMCALCTCSMQSGSEAASTYILILPTQVWIEDVCLQQLYVHCCCVLQWHSKTYNPIDSFLLRLSDFTDFFDTVPICSWFMLTAYTYGDDLLAWDPWGPARHKQPSPGWYDKTGARPWRRKRIFRCYQLGSIFPAQFSRVTVQWWSRVGCCGGAT